MPTDAERADALRNIPLFAGLGPAAREGIVRIAGELQASAGQVLVQPKTAGSGLFVVEEGTVVVERDGREIELGPGQFFGELALLTDTPRTARVRARTDALLLAISREEFGKLLEAEPRIAVGMLAVLAQRLAD
jgi:CRP-like cAMP-binding protein